MWVWVGVRVGVGVSGSAMKESVDTQFAKTDIVCG